MPERPARPAAPLLLRLAVLLTAPSVRPFACGFGIYAPNKLAANVTTPDDPLALAGVYRWMGRRPLLRYAIDPDFCSAMRPTLSETSSWTGWLPLGEINFTTCDRLENVVHDAFARWQAASPAVQFVDVSARCSSERLWKGIPSEHCTMSPLCERLENATDDLYVDWTESNTYLETRDPPPKSDECSHRTCWDCARADVVIGAFSQKNRDLGDTHSRSRVVRAGLRQMRPVGTDGKYKPGGFVGSAKLQFNADHKYMDSGTLTDKCWKLESDLCDWVALPATIDGAGAIGLAMGVLLAFLTVCCCCSCCICMRNLAYNMLAGYDLDNDGKLSFQELTYVLDEFLGEVCCQCRCPRIHGKDVSGFVGVVTVLETFAHLPVLWISLSYSGIVAVIVLYGLEFAPCLSCWDLPAAAAHGIGHVLSLDHPAPIGGGAIALNPYGSAPYDFPPPPAPPPDPFAEAKAANESIVNLPPASPPPLPPPAPLPPPPSPPPFPQHTAIAAGSESTHVLWCRQQDTLDTSVMTFRHANHPEGATPPYERFGAAAEAAYNESVMLQFGIVPADRPHAPGRARRCPSQDDLDGLNWLYPACGSDGRFHGFLYPPECGAEEAWHFVWQRALDAFLKLIVWLLAGFAFLKGGASFLLLMEECIAQRLVAKSASQLVHDGSYMITYNMPWNKRKRLHALQIRMAIKLQTAARMKKHRDHYKRQRNAASLMQALHRGKDARREIGVPGSNKARIYSMRLKMAKMHASQEKIVNGLIHAPKPLPPTASRALVSGANGSHARVSFLPDASARAVWDMA